MYNQFLGEFSSRFVDKFGENINLKRLYNWKKKNAMKNKVINKKDVIEVAAICAFILSWISVCVYACVTY